MQKKLSLSVFLVLLTVLVGCQKDEAIPIEQEPSTKRLIVTASDIPEVKNTLLKKMGITSDAKLFSANNGEQQSVLSIDWENIKQLVDTTGRETYTFGIKNTDSDPRVFYNLVLRYSEDHEARQPFILKYTMDDEFFEDYLVTRSLKNFRGEVQKIIINDPLTSSHLRGSASLDPNGDGNGLQLGDPCPDSTPVTGDGPGGGGGNNTDPDPDPGSGSSHGCTTYVLTTTWYSQTCSSGGCETPVVIAESQSIEVECNGANESNNVDSNTDCDPDEGETPIITPDIINSIEDPCLKSTVNIVINQNLTNDINNIMGQIFNVSENVNLVFKEDATLPVAGRALVDPTILNGNFNVNVLLNPSLTSSSREYVAAIIYHEILHALLLTQGPALDDLADHRLMADELLSSLISAFQEAFPSMSLQLARGLSIRGFRDIFAYAPDYLGDMLRDLDFEDLQEVLNLTDPHRDGDTGTLCN